MSNSQSGADKQRAAGSEKNHAPATSGDTSVPATSDDTGVPGTSDDRSVEPGTESGSYSQLHGRQKARPLSKRQKLLLNELLPKLELDPSKPIHTGADAQSRPVWLEIGFGGGEHLVQQAINNPDVSFIGCEPFINGVAKALMLIDDGKLENLKLYPNDARNILDWLKPESIDRAFVLYPDPWPKKRHHKRRFLGLENFNRLARVMKPGAELRIATDIGDYARHILMAYQICGKFTWTAKRADDWRIQPDNWPTTRYEQKALREGRKCNYFIFKRN